MLDTRPLIDHLKQSKPYLFPDRVVSSRTISDTSKSKDRLKQQSTHFNFNLPIFYAPTEGDGNPKLINNRYQIEDELEPSTFANLYIVY